MDHLPYKTVWIHLKEGKEKHIYIQVSSDIHKPEWVEFGKVLATAFNNLCDNSDFIDLVLNHYTFHSFDAITKLKSITLHTD
jgi:hypothetical protein